ncbi:MAG TPA: hypothetical protein VF138_11470 [Caulobacteraceae bacterium]
MRAIVLFAAHSLAACAATPSEAPISPGPAQVMVIPPTRAVPLPPRDPPAIVQSRLEAMPTAEVARWALPEHAERVVRVELMRVWLPIVRYGGFFERPRATDAPGVCQVSVHGVSFRPYRENELTYQQHLDPPLEPFQVTDAYRYKVVSSTLGGPPAQAACEGAAPYNDWIEGPSAHDLFRAMNTIERAGAYPRDYVITCQDERLKADQQTFETYACDGRALLARLTPGLLERVQGVKCEAAFVSGANPCWQVTFDDPKAPGTHSQYEVTAGARRVAIRHVLLPPM